MKRYSGKIGTHCHIVKDSGNGCYTYSPLGQDKNESFYLNETVGKSTEKKIKEIHFKSLADFDAKAEAGELPEAKKEYEIKVGQIIFTDRIQHDNRQERVIYEIENGRFGFTYKSVLLDGSKTMLDDRLTPWSKKFGIGVYFKEGEILEQDEINNLLISAHKNMKQAEALRKVQEQINWEQREEKEKYLSQFRQADRRKTTSIIKRHILKTWPEVRKVEVKTDVYSGGSSMDVRYYSPERINALDSFIDTFQYGRFNSMEDIYEYSGHDAPIIDGYILQTYKYCSTDWEEDNTPLPEKKENAAPEVITGAIVSHNDEKNGIEITFASNPGRDVINNLKAAGFRWSCRLKLWYAKQSEETKAFAERFK